MPRKTGGQYAKHIVHISRQFESSTYPADLKAMGIPVSNSSLLRWEQAGRFPRRIRMAEQAWLGLRPSSMRGSKLARKNASGTFTRLLKSEATSLTAPLSGQRVAAPASLPDIIRNTNMRNSFRVSAEMRSTNRLTAAKAYLAAGLKLIAIHGITAEGGCTCGKRDCSHKGKHPHRQAFSERRSQCHI